MASWETNPPNKAAIWGKSDAPDRQLKKIKHTHHRQTTNNNRSSYQYSLTKEKTKRKKGRKKERKKKNDLHLM